MSESDVREVSFEDALAEEPDQGRESGSSNPFVERRPPTPQAAEPQTVDAPESDEQREARAKIEQSKEDLDLLSPNTKPRQWVFGPEGQQKSYVQYELSVTGSAQWFGLLGEVIEELTTGENPLSINSLMAPPTPRTPGRYEMSDFQDADMFVSALGKLLTQMPTFLEKSVCIWLGVPDYEWDLVSALLRLAPSQGGMSFDMFEGILATFIDQNYSEIDRFFRDRYRHLRDRWQARAKEANQSRSQKR